MRALLVLAMATLPGCWVAPPCGGGASAEEADCPTYLPVRTGTYEAIVPDVEDAGEAVIDDLSVVLRYTDDEGNTWEVVYAREEAL